VTREGLRAEFRAKWPKGPRDKIRDDAFRSCSVFFGLPREHWVHLKTTNAIESTFASVRLRTKVTKDQARVPPACDGVNSSSPPRTAGRDQRPKIVALVRADDVSKGGLVESSLKEEEVAA